MLIFRVMLGAEAYIILLTFGLVLWKMIELGPWIGSFATFVPIDTEPYFSVYYMFY